MSSPKQRLNALHGALLRLHKSLLDSERASYESVHGGIPSPAAFLQLVIHDDWFSWLRAMSEFIIVIDLATDAKEPVTGAEADRLMGDARKLLTPDENGNEFAKRYFHALKRDVNVVLLHTAALEVLREDSTHT